jgi:hypothetical protein
MSIGQQDYSFMGDAALQQALLFAQRSNDTPKFLGLMAEMNKRKQLRTAAQGQQAAQDTSKPAVTEADKIMAGIANLSSGDHNYANGGIVAFAGGGMDSAGNKMLSDEELRQRIKDRAAAQAAQQVSPWQALSRMRDVFRSSIGLSTDPAAVAEKAAPTPAPGPMYIPTTPGVTPAEASADVGAGPRAERRPPATRPAPAPAAAAPAAPVTPSVPEPKILTAKEQMEADRAMAKGDDDKVNAIFAKAEARDAERRAKLADETKSSKGILGLEMDADTRRALRDFGIGALQSKSPNAMGGIGEGLAAAAKGYDTRKQQRQDREDLLDAAEEKRQLAKMAAEQGNVALANKYSAQEAKLKDDAAGRRLQRDTLTATERHQRATEDLQRQQLAATRANAGRNQQLEFYAALGGGDPKKGYEFAQSSKGAPAMDRSLMTQMLKDPELKTSNPNLYNYILSQLYGSGPVAVSTTPTGNVLK